MNKDPIAMQRAELGRITQGGKKEGGYTKITYVYPISRSDYDIR